MSDIKLERTPSIRLYICRLSWGFWLLMFPCFKLNNGGFPSILLSCCCSPELSILSAPRAADLADGHWVNLNKQRALRNTWKPKIHAFLKIIIFVWKKRVMCDISVRLTFILTWRNALLLFRICNLCYYGRVVHGNEMLRTFGYTVLFLGKHYQAHYSPPGCAQALERPLFATLKSHFCTSHTPVLTSETKYQREEEETEEETVTTAGPKCEVTVRCAGDKQSVSPASKPFVSDVAVAGSIAPAFCCRYCTLQLLSTHYNINCVIRLQCLPRDGDRRPTGPAGWLQQQHACNISIILVSPCWKTLSVRPPPTDCCYLVISLQLREGKEKLHTACRLGTRFTTCFVIFYLIYFSLRLLYIYIYIYPLH